MNSRDEALLLYREGKYSEALTVFLREKTASTENPDVAYYMGLCYARLSKIPQAIRSFKEVLYKDTDLARNYQVRMILAWLLEQDGDLDGAEEFLRTIIDSGLRSPQVWSALGHCQWKKGDKSLALKSYREAVELDAKNLNAVNGLGYLLAETGEELEIAIQLCRQAVENNPKNMAYRDSLGWALFRAGKTTEALKYLIEALSSCPGEEIIEQHLEAVRIHGWEKIKG